ncbi:iron ABC transporter permease [Microbacterium sp. CIAB417]|uniref:FecCD family ABC transporter permease n=1 Tax=Microbacterium sp. CIAB417 TaxID=2860287 RepID=UPI001FAE183D|nr:iron ABC transporter permease [Microbacterium sp. CIAB417]
MRPESPRSARRRIGLIVLLVLITVGVFVSACVGTRDISLESTWNAVLSFDPADSEHLLVVHQRIPRALLAVVVGLCLGVAGAVMQALTRNPLAEPGILGVNAGAAVAIAVGIAFFGITDVSGYMWLGLVGAAVAGVAVYLLGGVRRGTNPVRLVLAGAALTVVLGALTQLVLVNSPDQVFDRYRHWMVGSLAGRGYEVLASIGLLAAAGLLLALVLARPLDSALLGEDLSRSLGGSPGRVWALAGIVVIVLAGTATAAAGPIAFLGLAAPHLARLVAGVDHRWVLPYSALIASLLIVVADTLGRIIPPRGEISVGIMVALLGGPFFVFLVRRRRMVQL